MIKKNLIKFSPKKNYQKNMNMLFSIFKIPNKMKYRSLKMTSPKILENFVTSSSKVMLSTQNR